MSVFRKFKLPQLIRRGSPGSESGKDVPRFKCSELPVKQRIGQGSFGDVYTTEYKSSGETKSHTVVIKKMLQVLDQEEKKLFFKEITLLNDLHHPNIVRLKGVSLQPLAMMLEYVYFDFKHFGHDDLRVHSLSDFLLQIDEFNCEGLFEVLNHAAKEIIHGLAHLHSKGIAHRDLKPANILISNQHYCTLSDENEISRQFESRPVACKLTDFGESRSLIVQTQSFVASRTNNIDRGTVVYEAPELFVKEMLLSDASIGDFMLADIWALGMIFFSIINPSVKYPYRTEIRSAGNVSSQDELKILISSLLRQKKLPLADEKYAVERATVWRGLEDVYRGCANFDRHSRLSLEEAATILSRENKRVSDDLEVVQLKVSQATAVQQFDHRFAVQLKDNATDEPTEQLEHAFVDNDGTNACAFLSVKIADVILSEVVTGIEFFEELAEAIEDTIWHLPEIINGHRDLHRMYDVLEAYGILREQKIVTSLYDFSEELPFADTVFSYEGRQKLHSKLCDLGCNDFLAVFTCEPLVLTVGCRDGKPYMIDTHPVTLAPGKGNGLMMIGKNNSSDVWLSLCIWLWNRLQHQGVTPDTCQSLAVVTSKSSFEIERPGVSGPASGSGRQPTQADLPASGSKRARKEESERPYVSGPSSASGYHGEGASEQTHVNLTATGSKRARKEECERPCVSGPSSASGYHGESASEQTHVNSTAPGSKRARKEDIERTGVSGGSVGDGPHKEGWSEQAHANMGASDGQCPDEVVIVDGPDDSLVTKSAVNVRRSLSTSCVIIDLDAVQDPSSSSMQKRKVDISCSEADTVSCLSMCESVRYWKENKEIPVFESGKKSRYTPREAVEVIGWQSCKKPLCERHPLRVRENAAFIVNVDSYNHWEDIKDDMNGAYTKVLRCGTWTVECQKHDEDLEFRVVAKKELQLTESNQYHLVIHSKGNKACPSLVRSIFVLKDSSSKIVNGVALLQYHIDTGEDKVDFQVSLHGNSRKGSKAPFYPTAKSTLLAMKQHVVNTAPSHVYKMVSDQGGGSIQARTPGALPRSRKQVYDLKFRDGREIDPVDELLVYVRQKEENGTKICMRHEDVPMDLWVLGTKVMCADLGRFTSSEKLSHPICIDPTFNMGQFEVTPVVYKHLFLTSKRTGNNPVFLGPTMIHHKKDFTTYKALSSACVTNCKGLEKCRGYITDGEEALDIAWRTELPKARHLRCVKHFEGNCKQKLNDIGIKERNKQKFFLEKVFGVVNKSEGIVDAEDKQEVKSKVRNVKKDLDEREVQLLQKQDGYVPQFSKYLTDRQEIIGKTMTLKARRKARMPLDKDGKPIRPYTNLSESMNNVMSQAKTNFLNFSNKGKTQNLSKLEFTKHVFEEIHERQMRELQLALCGLSEEYQLDETVEHLAVSVNTWFDWSKYQREDYVDKFNAMSVDDALQGKEIRVTQDQEGDTTEEEYKELSVDVAAALKKQKQCKDEVVDAVIQGALTLLNHPSAIQQKPTLHPANTNKYQVASTTAKNKEVECTVNKSYVSCRCPSFKFDCVCKHSIAVADKVGILERHIQFICKPSGKKGPRSALAEANVNKEVAGKKGGKNKYPYRPSRSQQEVADKASRQSLSQSSSRYTYNEIHHNDNPFVLRILPKNAKKCKQCGTDFCHRLRIIPNDLVFEHQERFYFPLNGDWKQKQTSTKEVTRYYHADSACMKARFPYFAKEYIAIPPDVSSLLHESHKTYLNTQFGLHL